LPAPHNIAEEEEHIVIKERDKTEDLTKGSKEIAVDKPDAPSGLDGTFTGNTVVLTWDEVKEQGVRSYRVYRIENNGYEKAGETVVPVFIDEDIKKNSSYRYKVTAVGKTESDFSKEIDIITEDK